MTEINRPGSLRQSKETKVGSKITNFSGLGKKPKEKEGKTQKNVSGSEKEKKFGIQGTVKENTRGSRPILNSEPGDTEPGVNGTKKKMLIGENNSSVVDTNTSMVDSERLAASGEGSDIINLDSSVNIMRTYNDPESGASSIQVSTV